MPYANNEGERLVVPKDSQQNNEKNSCGSGQDLSPDTASTPGVSYPHIDPNAGSGDATDGRKRYQWTTGYPPEALTEIRWESIYLLFVFLFSLSLIFATWMGWIASLLLLTPEQAITLKKYAYCAASGMLGGVTFGIKYFYRVVARGYWHQDRRIWRLMSPLIAMTVALIIGTMIDASLIATREPTSGAAVLSIGFLVGYFADKAIAKMYEIANVIFGPIATKKADNGK